MILSYKEFTPPTTYTDKNDFKNQIMQSCYNDFKTINDNDIIDDTRLEEIGKAFQGNVVYSNIIWEGNHRSKQNAILNVDMLIFDIDEDLTIEQVHQMLAFKMMTLTTTSHTPEHHKFRVFIPLDKKVSFGDALEYTEFLKLFDTKYFNGQVDQNCLESARAYITRPNAQYKLNNIKDLFNPDELLEKAKVEAFSTRLRNTPLVKRIRTNKKQLTIDEVKNLSNSRKLVAQFRKGNHHDPVYRLIGVGKGKGLSSEECARMIMSYKLGKEYSNFNDLVKKASRYD